MCRIRKTANARRLFTGSDSYGRTIELAESAELVGVWFFRSWERNPPFPSSFTAWQQCAFTPKHPDKLPCKVEVPDAPEYVDIPEADRSGYVEWGFNILRLVDGPYNLRLPLTSKIL
jgi:hypothetical protein